jgi:type I restriction enzyme S subunit
VIDALFPKVKFKEIAQIVTGSTPSKKNSEYFGGNIPFVTPSELNEEIYVTSSATYVTESGADQVRIIPKNSVMVCCIGSLGKAAIAGRDLVTNQQINSLVVNEKIADPLYVYYYCTTLKPLLECMAPKTTVAIVNKSRFSDLEIPLPSLKIQNQIAAILKKADNLRKQCQQVERELHVLTQSVFLEMFGDLISNSKRFAIGTIRDVVSSVNYGTSEKACEGKGQYPILRMNNITYGGCWNFASLKYINLEENEKEKYLARKGDLLFNRTNSKELVGKTAVYREEKEMAIAGYLIRVRCNEKANAEYISGYLNSVHGKATLQHMCKSIVGMANINAQELQNIRILLPPKRLQDKYAEFMTSLLWEKNICLKQKNEIDVLFNVLLQKSFGGEVNLGSLKKLIEIEAQPGHV